MKLQLDEHKACLSSCHGKNVEGRPAADVSASRQHASPANNAINLTASPLCLAAAGYRER
jgi:hypothetical protein